MTNSSNLVSNNNNKLIKHKLFCPAHDSKLSVIKRLFHISRSRDRRETGLTGPTHQLGTEYSDSVTVTKKLARQRSN